MHIAAKVGFVALLFLIGGLSLFLLLQPSDTGAANNVTIEDQPMQWQRHLRAGEYTGSCDLAAEPEAVESCADYAPAATKKSEIPPFAIDAVVTWVDCADSEWQATYAAAAAAEDPDTYNQMEASKRAPPQSPFFCDEAYFAIRGLQRNCPFLRRIHVVTASPQRPAYLPELQKLSPIPLEVVHHDAFIPREVLPTFSSIVIESWLDCIPGIAEHFLNVNDDCIIMTPRSWNDFFTAQGFPRIQMQPIPIMNSLYGKQLRRTQALLQPRGWRVNFYDHVPHAFTRSRLQKMRTLFPRAIAHTMAHPIRQPSDYSVPVFMASIDPVSIEYVQRFPFTYALVNGLSGKLPKAADVVCYNNVNASTPPDVLRSTLLHMGMSLLGRRSAEYKALKQRLALTQDMMPLPQEPIYA